MSVFFVFVMMWLGADVALWRHYPNIVNVVHSSASQSKLSFVSCDVSTVTIPDNTFQKGAANRVKYESKVLVRYCYVKAALSLFHTRRYVAQMYYGLTRDIKLEVLTPISPNCRLHLNCDVLGRRLSEVFYVQHIAAANPTSSVVLSAAYHVYIRTKLAFRAVSSVFERLSSGSGAGSSVLSGLLGPMTGIDRGSQSAADEYRLPDGNPNLFVRVSRLVNRSLSGRSLAAQFGLLGPYAALCGCIVVVGVGRWFNDRRGGLALMGVGLGLITLLPVMVAVG